jgi:2-oxoglutarate ferredoxin oxidoreductase subunit gamma
MTSTSTGELLGTRRVVMGGFGGQGIKLATQVLARAAGESGLSFTHYCIYSGAIRGGEIECFVVVSDEGLPSPCPATANFGLLMSTEGVAKAAHRVEPDGVAIVNADLVDDINIAAEVRRVPFTSMATQQFGDPRVASMIAIAYLTEAVGLFGGWDGSLEEAMRAVVPPHRRALVEKNASALSFGRRAAVEQVVDQGGSGNVA